MIRNKKTRYVFLMIVLTVAMLTGISNVKTFFNTDIEGTNDKLDEKDSDPNMLPDDYGEIPLDYTIVKYREEVEEIEVFDSTFLTDAASLMPSGVFAMYKGMDYYSSSNVKGYKLIQAEEKEGSLICQYEALLTDLYKVKDGLENARVNVIIRLSEGSDIEEVKNRIETELATIKMQAIDEVQQNTSIRKASQYSLYARNGMMRAASSNTHNVSGSFSSITCSQGDISIRTDKIGKKFEGIGKYWLNGTGASNVSDVNSTRNYIHCNNSDVKSLESDSGQYKGNSSGAKLEAKGKEIVKAYLVVEYTDEVAWASYAAQDPSVYHKPPVVSYESYTKPIKFAAKGSNGDIYYMNTHMKTFCHGDTFRCSSYMDVTEFVQQYGYTWYYCVNIPFREDGLSYNTYVYSGSDHFACWKLITIEKDSDLENVRYTQLDLGATDATWVLKSSHEHEVVSFDGFVAVGNKGITGAYLYSMAGADSGDDRNILRWQNHVKGEPTYRGKQSLYDGFETHRTSRDPLRDKITIYGRNHANNNSAYVAPNSEDGNYTHSGADLAIEEFGKTSSVHVANKTDRIKFNYDVATEGDKRCDAMLDAVGVMFDVEIDCSNTIDTIEWNESTNQYIVQGTSKCESDISYPHTGYAGYYGMRTNIYIPNRLQISGASDISITSTNINSTNISYDNASQNITIKWGRSGIAGKNYSVFKDDYIKWRAVFTPKGSAPLQRAGHDLRQNNWNSTLEVSGVNVQGTTKSAAADGMKRDKASSTVETLTINPRGGMWRSSMDIRFITKIVQNEKPGNNDNGWNEGIEDPTCPTGWRFNGWLETEKKTNQNQWSSTPYTRDQWTATTWTSSFKYSNETANAADYTIEAHYKRVESGLLVNLDSYTNVGNGFQTVLAEDWVSRQEKTTPDTSAFSALFNAGLEDNIPYNHEGSTTLSKTSQHTTDDRICQCQSSAGYNKGRYQDTDTVPDPKPENYDLILDFKDGWIEPTYSTPDETLNSAYSFPHTGSGYHNQKINYKRRTDRAFKDFSVTEVGNSYRQYGYDASHHKFTHPEMESDTYLRANYTGSYILYLPTVERYGYNFMGWYNEEDNSLFTDDNSGVTIIMDKNLHLYAKWELITKDETFNVYWLDNSNNYTTRPEAVFVELYRISGSGNGELCKTYITEELNTETTDFITRFSNETGMSQVPVPKQGAGSNNRGDKSKGIWQPNTYYTDPTGKTNPVTTKSVGKDIFKSTDGSTYYVRITGNNSVPATTNTWTVTLKDLQKYDVTKKDTEYDYNIKERDCTSLDRTTRYYASSKNSENNYTTDISKYYKIRNYEGESGSIAYDDIAVNRATNYFSNDLVNRITNVEGTSNWKNVCVNVIFKDGADKFHLRPYEMTVQLWQNIPHLINTISTNDLDNKGIRRLLKSQQLTPRLNPYSSVDNSHSIYVDGLSYIFDKNLTPTVQPESGIKYSYDVVLTHNQTRYRYTLDPSDPYNNLIPSNKKSNGHYFSSKHRDITTSIIDLDYTKMLKNGAIKTGVQPSEAEELLAQGWEFAVPMDTNNIYQSVLNSQDAYSDQLNKIVLANGSNQTNYYDTFKDVERGSYARTETAKAFTNPYSSLAYNLRYYYITESRRMSTKDQSGAESIKYITAADTASVDDFHNVGYLKYKEYLHWDFVCTLFGTPETSLPTEYTGSESADDRTGVYKTVDNNDDYTHTNNTLTVVSHVYDDYSNTNPEYDSNKKPANGLYKNKVANGNTMDYDRLDTAVQRESFLITLKQVQKNWTTNTAGTASDENGNSYNIHDGNNTGETYNNARYSLNGKRINIYNNSTGMLLDIHESGMADEYLIGDMVQYESDRIISLIGNEYNIVVPAQGSTTLEYIPDGKYEISCHYDIDFRDFEFDAAGRNVTFTYENQAGNEVDREDKSGKWYVTFSSQHESSMENLTHKSEIDKWRGYVDDEYTVPVKSIPAKDFQGYNVTTNTDDKIADKNKGSKVYPNNYEYHYRYWRNTYISNPYSTMN